MREIIIRIEVIFGKRVKDIDSLPKKVIEFIKYITR